MCVNLPSHMITSGKNGHRMVSRNVDHQTLTVDSGLADPVYLCYCVFDSKGKYVKLF